jgi:hypothetical protein
MWVERARKSSGGRECEFEGLFEKETTEDHELMSVAILRLHDRGRLETRSVHKDDVVGLTEIIVGVCYCQMKPQECVCGTYHGIAAVSARKRG